MANNVTMTAADTISGKMGECYITIKGNRYNFAQVKDISAKIEKKKVKSLRVIRQLE